MALLRRHQPAGPARAALLTALCLGPLAPAAGAVPAAPAAAGDEAGVPRGVEAAPSRSVKARATRGVGRPTQASPGDGARVEAVPPFSWQPVRRAAKYEFQLSADGAFRSVVDRGSFETLNTFATIDKTLADGNYFWRARAIDSRDRAGRWSRRRSVAKRWSTRPTLLDPGDGASVAYPNRPLVLRWQPVPYAYKYLVTVGTDPSLATSVVGTSGRPVETQGTAYAVPGALAPGTRYFWAVIPLDSAGHRGSSSRVGSFVWNWNSGTTTRLDDVNSTAEVNDPRFSWARVPGAARYEVEVSTSPGFAAGSKVCCDDKVIGTSLTPTKLLPNNDGNDAQNNGYYWRVRAFDVNGNPGDWNRYPTSFAKEYDATDPSIRQLRVRDNAGDPLSAANPPLDLDPTTDYLDTSSPIVSWAPVPGASSYHVRVVPWGALGCQWSTTGGDSWGVSSSLATASTSWSPFGGPQASPVDTGSPPLSVQSESQRLVDGKGYCARVTARSGTDTRGERVIGKSIELGALAAPAFRYRAPVTPPSATPVTMAATDYLQPVGSTVPRMPLFTWRAKAGACAYFVVVAKDQAFTNVVDVARTIQPSYAPRLRTYPDESTAYYWVVLPVQADPANPASCSIVPTTWSQNNPRSFQKESVPPTPLEPADGERVASQPSFRWTGAEAACDYRLQVSRDPNFQDGRLLLADVTTAATAYTSSSTFPADATVYWRVRANDENGTGLKWSATRTFRRSLGVPQPLSGNPTGGEFLPVLSWTSVPGAVSYHLHVDQADGTTRDFTLRSTAFTPTLFYGTGVWSWQVQANFPGAFGRVVSGGYSARRAFTRYIGAPTGARSTSTPKRLLVAWDPSRAAKKYRVQFSESNSFSKPIDSATVENTNYAPRLTQAGFLDGGPIYWRVAAVDEGGNLGAWSTGQVKLLRRLVVRVKGSLIRGRRGVVRISVKSARGGAVRGARVTPRGAGVRSRSRRTGKRGTVKLRLRPRVRGTIRFRVDKRGFRPGSAKLRIR